MVTKIISGGQTGADRAALDFAIKNNIPHGGWMPKGRKTEEGPLPGCYNLQEMATESYTHRTEQNVIDSDGTLIISHGELTEGSALTRDFAQRHRRPYLHVDLNEYSEASAAAFSVRGWIARHAIKTLNVAGPRASKDEDIYRGVMNLLEKALRRNNLIDVVLFDFGGVLSEEGWKKGHMVIARAHGLDADVFLKTANDIIYETGYILGKCSASDFWNALRKRTGISGSDASLMQEVMSRFQLRNQMIDLVKKLKADNLTVGILSDQTDMLDKLNARFDFFKWFDYVFNSYHVGKGKRDITLFDDIAGILKTAPDRILFIDDDPGHIERAKQKGWQAILFLNYDSLLADMDIIINPADRARK